MTLNISEAMAQELYLIRHAHAKEKSFDQKDIFRTLSTDGVRMASKLGLYFAQKGIIPDIIISSPADRAISTAMLVAEQLKYDVDEIHSNDELYEASVRTFLQVINFLKDEWGKVFIVGHNPVISYFAEYISNSEIDSMSPGAVVKIVHSLSGWNEVSEHNCEFASYFDPETRNM